jgi:hypothetical protein
MAHGLNAQRFGFSRKHYTQPFEALYRNCKGKSRKIQKRIRVRKRRWTEKKCLRRHAA